MRGNALPVLCSCMNSSGLLAHKPFPSGRARGIGELMSRCLTGFLFVLFSDGGINLPGGERSIFGYFVDLQNCEFMPWSDLVPSAQTIIQKGKYIIFKGFQLF